MNGLTKVRPENCARSNNNSTISTMKNPSFTFLLFLLPCLAAAQASLGIRATAATYRYDMIETSAQDHSSLKMCMAVPLDIPVTSWFSIQPELAFSQRDLKSVDRDAPYDGLQHRQSSNFDLTISPRVTLHGKKLAFFIESGLTTSFAVKGEVQYGFFYSYDIPGTGTVRREEWYQGTNTKSPGDPRWELGLTSKAGLSFQLNGVTAM